MELTDAGLVARVLDGDESAYAVLVDRYHGRCLRYAMRMLGSREDAEEACQDTFLRAYRALGRYEDADKFSSWIFRILVNRCRTYAQRRRGLLHDVVEAETLERLASVEPEGERGFALEALQQALAQLDAEQREAFLLKHVEQLSYDEIAAATGLGVSALKMRVKRACDRLRTLLTPTP